MSAGAGRPPDDDETKTAIFDRERGGPARSKPMTRRGYDRHQDLVAPEPAPESRPIRALSRKSKPGLEQEKPARQIPEVKLRSMEEVRAQPAQRGLGNLAPPRDPKQARSRRVNDYVIWGSVAVIVASIVMLLVWFLAR